jgi:hypothetical protein
VSGFSWAEAARTVDEAALPWPPRPPSTVAAVPLEASDLPEPETKQKKTRELDFFIFFKTHS